MAMMNITNLVTIKLDDTHFILRELQLLLVRSQQLLGFLDGTTDALEKWIECSTSTDGSVKVSKRIFRVALQRSVVGQLDKLNNPKLKKCWLR
jgi:hypothetical protein